jgi:hypothetical protein
MNQLLDENGDPIMADCPMCDGRGFVSHLLSQEYLREKTEIERLRDAVAFLRSSMDSYRGQRMCSPACWREFERRVDG